MPKLGLTMEEGKIVEWRKKEGEKVEKGEILFVIETEKVTFEVEAEASGILGKIVAMEGDVLPVGGLVAYVLEEGEKISDIPEIITPKKEEPKEHKIMGPTLADVTTRERLEMPTGVKISPAARKIAEEYNIDITSVKGTGPEGRIVKEDILRVVDERKMKVAQIVVEKEVPTEEKLFPLSPLRKTIAKRMTESFQIPHFYMTIEVDTQELVVLRDHLMSLVEKEIGVRLTHTDLLVKMVAKVLEDNPSLNCAFVDYSVKLFNRIHIGIATAVEGGLIVPVIRDANKKTLIEICLARSEIVEKTRARKVTQEDITGSTFTITNVGMWGVDFSNPIINPPEAAILAVGAIKDKPVARDGKIEIRPIMKLTLSIDHRVLDGSDAAGFLNGLKKYIEDPKALFIKLQ
jgi:pyruvate dehydrogenase E2 component (dihydrolipoamide acetyltransferase)